MGRSIFSTFLVLTLLLFQASCGNDKKSAPAAETLPPSVEFASGAWSVESVRLDCGEKQCPEAVGMLVFVGPQQENGLIPIRRCTAFLVAPNRIASVGHCDRSRTFTGYFITSSSGGRHVRKVMGVAFKKFSAGHGEFESGRPDIGLYDLESPILNIRPFEFAEASTSTDFSKLIGYVVNRSSDADNFAHYTIETIECRVRKHRALFPFDLSENPDVITGFGCTSRQGNSGAPLFAPGSWRVQAILQGSGDRKAFAEQVRRKHGRSLFRYEDHQTVTATNARCFHPVNPAQCVANESTVAPQRFARFQQIAAENLRERQLEKGGTEGVRYKAFVYQMKNSDEGHLRFEVFHLPICRTASKTLDSVEFVSEWIELAFDEWAELTVRELGQKTSTARVQSRHGDRLSLQADWSNGFGPLIHEQDHPRRRFGRKFAIDLPACP